MTDELKPVRCGCGGEAKVQRVRTLKSHVLVVMCTKCEIATNYYTNEAEAVEAWNRAMGATDTNVGDKERTAKVMNDGVNYCENCEGYVEAPMAYCPYCGCRLEWK